MRRKIPWQLASSIALDRARPGGEPVCCIIKFLYFSSPAAELGRPSACPALAIPISGYPVRNCVLTHQLSRLFLIDSVSYTHLDVYKRQHL